MNNDEKIDKILNHVERMDRAIYGDAPNKIPGLIDLPERVNKVEESHKRIKWLSLGLSTAMPAIILFVKNRLGL